MLPTSPPGLTRILITPRQMEILRLVASGSTNVDIARRLNISHNTVRLHLKQMRSRIYQSVEIEGDRRMTRSQLVIFALQAGIQPVERSGFEFALEGS